MKAPDFWWSSSYSSFTFVLSPFAFCYDLFVRLRLRRKSERIPIPVLCVGNFVMGGAGKTPTALALGKRLKEKGYRCAFLSRGYGGRLSGPILVDLTAHSALDVGDEPLLLARQAQTIVSRDRVAGAKLCQELGADIIIMDDGMQNPSLYKDIVIAVWDSARGIGNGLCFPAGPLRASLTTQATLADAIIVIDSAASEREKRSPSQEVLLHNIPIYDGRLIPDKDIAASLSGKRIIAFAGIGYPSKFYNTLRSCGAELIKTYDFDDHHPYSEKELWQIVREAQQLDCEVFTTTKDSVRIPVNLLKNKNDNPFRVLSVELCCEKEDQLVCFLEDRLFHNKMR